MIAVGSLVSLRWAFSGIPAFSTSSSSIDKGAAGVCFGLLTGIPLRIFLLPYERPCYLTFADDVFGVFINGLLFFIAESNLLTEGA